MTLERALSDTLSALVTGHDLVDVLANLVDNCALHYPASAVAILVMDGGQGLELLTATSHRVEELELLQIQHERGPCIDAMQGQAPVIASGPGLIGRWGEVGVAIHEAGFNGVHAYPLRWRGRALGGLNIFMADAAPGDTTQVTVGQLFADLATLAVVQSSDVPIDQVTARVHEAICARSVVEQAKGVLSYQLGVDMASAYDVLRDLTRAETQGLSNTAARIVSKAQRPGWPGDGAKPSADA